jgi:rhomboid family GlyGly-CTERM serine protease
MGLINRLISDAANRGRIGQTWLLPAVIAIFCLATALAGEEGREWLRWDRDALANGQLWRTVTGHFVHLSWSHLLLNLGAFFLVWMIVGDRLAPRIWVLVIAVCVAGMGVGFWYMAHELQWYVGMSGLLHGLLMAGLIVGIRSSPTESLLIGSFVVAKLVFEQLSGPLPGSASVAGGAVIVDAHLYGALSGAIIAVLYLIRVRAVRDI